MKSLFNKSESVTENEDRVKKILEKIGIEFHVKEPFYGVVFSYFKKAFQTQIKTIGLNFNKDGIELCINPNFLANYSYKQIKDILIHEILHFSFKHIVRLERINLNPALYNIAADLTINQKLKNLPENTVTIEKVFGQQSSVIEKNREAEYYYRKLPKTLNPQNFPSLDNHEHWFKKTEQKEKNIDEVLKKAEAQDNYYIKKSEEESNSKQTIALHKKEDFEKAETHFSGIDKINIINEVLKKAFLACENNIYKLPGTINGSLLRHLEDDGQFYFKKKWNTLLQEFVNYQLYRNSFKKYEIKRNKRRPNKKTGFPSPGIKIEPLPELSIAVCIDGSGSITEQVFQDFMHEINCMVDRNIKITLIGFDADVKEENVIYQYNPNIWNKTKNMTDLFPAPLRGGTNFRPVISYISKIIPPPDCIIMYTDTFDQGNLTKPQIPMLFIVTEIRAGFYPWARCIRIEELNEE